MHKPRPHGRFGDELQADDAAAAEALLRRVTNLKEQSGLSSLRMTRALPDGGSVTALDMGGVVKTIVTRPTDKEPSPQSPDAWSTTSVPMLFSGIVATPRVRWGEKVTLDITDQTKKRLQGYKSPNGGAQVPARVALERFVIPYAPRFQEFEPKMPSAFQPTQYTQLRATWYSGAMAQVVQIISGYGKRKFNSKPKERLETAQLALPEKVRTKIEQQLAGTVLPGYTGVPPADGQVQYDYKHAECHAVAFGTDNKPWLLQISTAGVFAMPLPMVPATTTQAFRAWVEEVGDEELKWVLDRFGGMPSGEPFPSRSRQAWERAGVVVKVCDTADFYRYSAYSTACGWSFNTRGTEGYNTCWDYDEGEGLAYGLMYSMTLRMGGMPKFKDLRGDKRTDNEGDAAHLGRYLQAMQQRVRADKDGGPAVAFKLYRATAAELIQRAKVSNEGLYDAEYQDWSAKQSPPIANHSGQVVQVKRGWLHHGATWDNQPQLKFPEPLLGYCVSFDFRPLMHGRGKDPKCDTPMFAYYVGDDLKVVHYSKDPRKVEKRTEDDYHDCMIVGSWTRHEFAGSAALHGHFYTSDWDDRQVYAETETTTHIVGKDKGYDTQPWFSFDAQFWRPGTLWRNRYYTHETNTKSSKGKSIALGLCVPYLCRNALLYARKDTTTSGHKTQSLALHYVQDPYSYRYWTYDFVMHWAGSLEKMAGKPFPKDGSPVWVEIENYAPSPCSDFADNGPWIPGLPADYTWLVHPQAGVYHLSGGGGAPPVDTYVRSTPSADEEERGLQVSLMPQPQDLGKGGWVSNHYFVASPSSHGMEFYRDAVRTVAGDSEYGSVWESPPGYEKRHRHFGYTRLADHTSSHCFIGVINE